VVDRGGAASPRPPQNALTPGAELLFHTVPGPPRAPTRPPCPPPGGDPPTPGVSSKNKPAGAVPQKRGVRGIALPLGLP